MCFGSQNGFVTCLNCGEQHPVFYNFSSIDRPCKCGTDLQESIDTEMINRAAMSFKIAADRQAEIAES
jgi:hypothetical protein